MAPDVLLRKLTYLRRLLNDLSPYKEASLAEVEYEILHQSIPGALEDFAQFVAIFAEYQSA